MSDEDSKVPAKPKPQKTLHDMTDMSPEELSEFAKAEMLRAYQTAMSLFDGTIYGVSLNPPKKRKSP